MIRENRILLEPGDITHVRLTCIACHSTLLIRTEDDQQPPNHCPTCRTPLWDERLGREAYEPSFIFYLRRLSQQTGSPKVKLQLESLDA